MAGVSAKSFDSPDEKRTPDKTILSVVDLGGAKAARMEIEPGWKWSECIQPIVGTDSCEMRHVGVVTQGRMHVQHNDGTGVDLGPGDAYLIEPGHDAWVTGNEPCVGYEFESATAETFAKS
jgi:hypothetical protein